ncbi:hypothetical protein [Streptomyces cadmiisoli]|uniref:hypothetical protein n=1 Tax=Streptomyces cadmiisoli TaxID=2184053 RepID=UPI003D74435E
MSNRYLDLRGATGRAAPLVVLRCAALLAVLMWLLPVCTHSAEEAVRTTPAAAPAAPAPAASVPGSAPADSVPGTSVPTASGPGDPPAAAAAARAFRAGDVHDCPDLEHRPGDTHCRPAAKAVASTASSGVPVPPPRATDVTGAGRDGLSPPCRGTPDVLVRTPGIHRLGIQRI